ncbi:MAG: MotA/TolQ/ExbB proton channel family protein [Longimicrobiales bacterium]
MEQTQTTSYSLLNIFYDGGWFMYPLVLCSLFALGVIIAKGYTLWAAQRRSAAVLDETDALLKNGRIDQALELAAETPGPVAAILYSGLHRLRDRQTSEDIENGVKTTGVVELGFLERGLVILATISNVAPLLGFLGTVAGMISAFGAIAAAGQVEASLVAGGIKVALITTAAGLTIAIPVNISYNFFVTRIDKLIREMEQGTANILNTAWDMRPAMAGGAPSVAGESLGAARPGYRPATDSVEGQGLPDRNANPDSDHLP